LASNNVSGPSGTTPEDLARIAADLALEKKGEDVIILDLRGFSLGCDFFVILTATSGPHVKALAEWIEDEMIRRHGAKPWHREGLPLGAWVLLDYVDFVVHIFDRESREHYMLERLWGDAPREERQGPEGAAASFDDEEDEG